MNEKIKQHLQKYRDILNEQIFLQDQGVSFEYTDNITYFDRLDMLQLYIEFIQEKNKKMEEEAMKARAK